MSVTNYTPQPLGTPGADDKLAELILHISKKAENDLYFGAIKLNKILFYADFLHYQRYGKPITGATYMRLPNGPVPRRLVPVRDDLIAGDKLVIQERRIGTRTQQRPIPLREPDLSSFSATEISLVDDIINSLNGATATSVSDFSHRHTMWKIAENNCDIPYEAVFLAEYDEASGLSLADAENGVVVAKEKGWDVVR
ncbi:Panacea domain-containing protein [Verrucomicrobium sp. BvORR106]|uniref:Panacea domain-containing protein n=1 Tax=Verrucomicrobium sp. BvORR106 TaxID=1403819 RepID=UPI00056EACAC|nr:Panacea domain-containing protein [Verrucomicrobium sp. BvORR106]